MGRRSIYLVLALLVILHQDFWWWEQPLVVLGFLPASLAYHAVYCLVAAAASWVAARRLWREDGTSSVNPTVTREPPQ